MTLKSIFSFCILGLVSVVSQNSIAKENASQTIMPVKLHFTDIEIARKIAISYHHAILETNYKDGYIIADLAQDERNDLVSRGLKVTSADDWMKEYNRITSLMQKNSATLTNQTQIFAGIEGFECYATVEETYQQAQELANNNSTLAEWVDIGNSWKRSQGLGGYDLMVLKITNQAIAGDKPKLFIHSAMHAREYTPAALTLDFAKLLINDYETDADIQWIVNHHEIHILFHMNPDGRKIAETQVYQRKNTNQNHCPSGDVGVDLNRNFAFSWNSTSNGSSGYSCDQDYRGPSAESEPETQAVSDYIRSLFPDSRGPADTDAAPDDTPGMHLDIHSYSQLVLWPFGHTNRPSPNDASFIELGNKLAWFNNYAPMQSVGLYPTDGTSDDVSYGELGIAALTFELGTQFFQQCSSYETTIKPKNLSALVYAAKVVSAPYQLPFGPEVSDIAVNGQTGNSISVSAGSSIELSVTANAIRTKLSGVGRLISRVEYSVDEPLWSESANIVELTENDGSLTSGVESFTGYLDTSGLALGQHIIYAQAYGSNQKVGVPSAVFINIGANVLPTASFSHQCNGLTCSFDASTSSDSDGSVATYSWDFGNGNTGQGVTADYTFASEGDKSVVLSIVDNSGGSAQHTVTVTVTDAPQQQAPLADFSVNCTELQCSFDASASSDADGTISNYSWNFNNEGTAEGAMASYTFDTQGDKSITLTVTDDSDLTANKTESISITQPEPPAPPTSQSSGGGSLGWLLLTVMGFAFRRVRLTRM